MNWAAEPSSSVEFVPPLSTSSDGSSTSSRLTGLAGSHVCAEAIGVEVVLSVVTITFDATCGSVGVAVVVAAVSSSSKKRISASSVSNGSSVVVSPVAVVEGSAFVSIGVTVVAWFSAIGGTVDAISVCEFVSNAD